MYFCFKASFDSEAINVLKAQNQNLNEQLHNLKEEIERLTEKNQKFCEENQKLIDEKNEVTKDLLKKIESNQYLQEEFDNHITSNLI
jgi:phage host-nuclease inhibitor protein Gam